METAIEIAVVLVLILLNAVFAMTELALVSSRRARLMVLERKGVTGAARARRLADDPQIFLPTVQFGMTLVSILAGVFGGARLASDVAVLLERIPMLGGFADDLALLLTVIAITYLTLVLGELVPKQLALRRPEPIACAIATPITALARLCTPIVWLLGRSTAIVLRLLGAARPKPTAVTEEELRAVLAEGAQAGVLETEERDMIERVLRLADKPVRAIMTPRTELAWIDRSSPRREIIATLMAAPHSRFVVSDGSVDNVVGVVQAKDMLDRLLEGKELSVAATLRQPVVIPDQVSALDALERLRADAFGLALVMDEYGSFEGVVTAADVLEAIIGDASAGPSPDDADDHASGQAAMFEGLMPVDELQAQLGLPDLPDPGGYHTLAGLLLALLQRVPQVGDRIVFGGWRFEVMEMDGRRVDRVQVTREPTVAS